MRRIPMVLAVTAALLAAAPAMAEEGTTGSMRGSHHRGQMFQQMDKDGNGSVSKEEFVAGAEERFARMDKNGDGVLTKDDMPERPAGERRGRRGGGDAVPGVTVDAPPAE